MTALCRAPLGGDVYRSRDRVSGPMIPFGVSPSRFWKAITAASVADVLAGVTRLDNAVKKAKKRKIERSTEAAKLAKLRERYVDLADLVADERAGSRPPELEAFYSWNLSSL